MDEGISAISCREEGLRVTGECAGGILMTLEEEEEEEEVWSRLAEHQVIQTLPPSDVSASGRSCRLLHCNNV